MAIPVKDCKTKIQYTGKRYMCTPNTIQTVLILRKFLTTTSKGRGKGKAVQLQAWGGPEGSRKLRLPDFVTTAQDGGRLSAPAVFTHRKYSWYSFLLEAESTPGP